MRKPTKKGMTSKLDKKCSEKVRSIGHCVHCGSQEYEKLQCAHIFSRTYKSVRFDLKNLLCLCAKCHFFFHKNPILFTEFVKRYLGDYEYEALKMRALPTSHHKVGDLQNIYTALEAI